jgi:Zn-finger nucleic acid-binding protein
MPAEIITCRGCGAPVDPQAKACAYCGSPFLLVECEGCGRPVVFGAGACPQCQAPGPKALPLVPTQQGCPTCDGMLHRPSTPAAGLAHCLRCGGLWVEAELFVTLCAEACSAKGRRLPERKGTGEGKPKEAFYRPCPECTRPMNRHLFAPGSKVILDNCREHGVWLDEGEWPHLAAFLREGGLAKAGLESVPYLKLHFSPGSAKAAVTLPQELLHAQGPTPTSYHPNQWIGSSGSNLSLGWLLVDVLFSVIDAATDD